MDINKFEIGSIPIKTTRMILLLLFYVSSIKKPCIYLIIFIIISFTESIIIYKNQVSITALTFVLLSRCVLLFYSYKTIKWFKMIKINFLYVFIVPILIGALFFTMYINNINFYNNKIMFIIVALSCEALLLIIIFKSFITFLKDQKKGNKEFLIGTVITLLADLFYSVQDVSTSVDPDIVGISSFLYSIGFYMILISHQKRIEEN